MSFRLGSPIVGGGSLKGGMPIYKYIADRFLTALENLLLGAKMSEFHTGYRAFNRAVLLSLPLLKKSDDFVFDNQILAQCIYFGYRIGDVSCPTRYLKEASSIGFCRSVVYGFGVLVTNFRFWLQRVGVKCKIFDPNGRQIDVLQQCDRSGADRCDRQCRETEYETTVSWPQV